jgi:hypothetical protein
MFCFLVCEEPRSKFIHQITNCLSAGNSFITKFTSTFSPTLSSRSVFHIHVIQKHTLLWSIANHVVPHCWLTVNWEQLAHGADNYCLLLRNQNKLPCMNMIPCRGLQVNYHSFQTLSAIKHAESSAKLRMRPAGRSASVAAKPGAVNSSTRLKFSLFFFCMLVNIVVIC